MVDATSMWLVILNIYLVIVEISVSLRRSKREREVITGGTEM